MPIDVLILFELVLGAVDLAGNCAAVTLTSFVMVGVDGSLYLSSAVVAIGTLLRVFFFRERVIESLSIGYGRVM